MSLPFSEWSREAKDEFAQKRMEEMKLKNEALKQRYAEVQQDRMKAEAKDSSVTSLKTLKKENVVIEKEIVEEAPKVTKEREWDREKIDQDAEDWSPPKFHGYRSRTQRRNFPDRRTPKKEENWRVRSSNTSKDRQSYSKYRSSGPNHKYQETSNYGTSSYRNENSGFPKQRGRTYRTSSGTYKSFQNSRFEEPKKKSISGGAGSASPSLSDSEVEPIKRQPKPESERMWQDGGITEVQHKQSRVEKWVKSINTSSSWNEEFDNVKGSEYYHDNRAEAGPRDSSKGYGYANEEGYSKRVQSSRDQPYLKNRERYDGLKYGQASRGNSRGRGNRNPTGERIAGGFDNKNQRDVRKKNYGDKNRFRRESDLSDRTSSMKESDYHDCSKDKFNKTMSDSKSSDYSGKWEDEECEFKYSADKRPYKHASVSGSQDETNKDGLNDEYGGNTRQKFPNSYARDKFKTKNFRNTDHSEFDDQHLDNKSGGRKFDAFSRVKANKGKTESKFGGHPGKLENENVPDTFARAGRKYKTSKPSPKRTLSNPVKSLDTSSSASKTMEFNSPDDDVWGDYEDTGAAWNLDGNNGSQAKDKNSIWEEEADCKVAQPLNSITPEKGNCDSTTENLHCQNSGLLTSEISEDAVPEEFHGDSYVKETNVENRVVLICSNQTEESIEGKGTAGNFVGVTSEQKDKHNDLDESKIDDNSKSAIDPDPTSEIFIHGPETDCYILTDEKHTDNVEYSVGKSEDEDKLQPPTSKQINNTDSCESKTLREIVSDKSMSSRTEISASDVQNSQSATVQPTEQICNELPNSANLELSGLKTTQGEYNMEDAISNKADCELLTSPTAENDKTESCIEMEALSSQNIKADNFESAIKSSSTVTTEPKSPKQEENYSGALNLSDDGGWSTVSEDENNDAADEVKNIQKSSSGNELDT